jgi:hypothetical protein
VKQPKKIKRRPARGKQARVRHIRPRANFLSAERLSSIIPIQATENDLQSSSGTMRPRIGASTVPPALFAGIGNKSECLGLVSALDGMRLIPSVEEERQEKIQDQLSRLYSVPMGKGSLDELVSKGVDPKILVEYLWLIRSASPKSTKDLGAVPGVPLRTIKKLPQLLRRVSFQIEAIRKHGYDWTPEQMLVALIAPRYQAMYIAEQKLPGFLRSYSRALSARLSVRKNRKHKTLEPSTECKVRLAEHVRTTSEDRKQHYEALAVLINVYFDLEGVASRVTAGSLKALWNTHPELRREPQVPDYTPVRPALDPSLGTAGEPKLPGLVQPTDLGKSNWKPLAG